MGHAMTGILGGSFDPIHKGHLQIATKVVDSLSLQQLQFMPCAVPVHRHQLHTSAQHRLNMIEMVVSKNQSLAVNTVELERQGPSYTIDSLRQMRAQSDAVLVLVLGADAFNNFAGWKNPQEILSLTHLVVCPRPGVDIDPRLFPHNRVGSVRQLRENPAGAILKLEFDQCHCSSTAVRQSLVAGEPADDCLATEVIEYIKLHKLYRSVSD